MFEYYYNHVPGVGLCRNNLVYTSKIDRQNKLFSVHYTYDQMYHMNKCLSEDALEIRWQREIKFTKQMIKSFPEHVLEIKHINMDTREIIFNIKGDDFWQLANCNHENYNDVLPDWQEQIIKILKDYRRAGIWKYSLHPSSFFVVDGKLKNINHFFCYNDNEQHVAITEVLDHISDDRKDKLLKYLDAKNIQVTDSAPWGTYAQICLESFKSNYPTGFIERAKEIYV